MMEKHTNSTSRIIICLATILLLGAPTAHGERLKAKIEFTPKTVVPLVTLRLNLKCALIPADSSDEDGVFDVKAVLGVSIKQKNSDGDFETVASVSTSNPDDPKLYGNWDDKDISIDAHLEENSRLLEVTVPDPTVEFTGELRCEIFVNDGEEVETLSNQDTIGYQDPDTKIFLSEMRRLKLRDEAQMTKINNLEKEVVKKQQITQARLGYEYCTPPRAGEWRYVHVRFGRIYAKPPRVFLSHENTKGASSGGVYGPGNNRIGADRITTTGFRLNCWAYNKMEILSVNWIAFPRA